MGEREWTRAFPSFIPCAVQLFDRESCTYSYVLADPTTREAIIIDPVLEMLDRDLELLNEHGLILKYALNTHVVSRPVRLCGRQTDRPTHRLSFMGRMCCVPSFSLAGTFGLSFCLSSVSTPTT